MVKIWEKIRSFSKEERFFIFFAMFCGFFICAEYSVVRPVSNSVFITAYGTQFLPYVWLTVIPLNFLAVFLYNRFLPRLGCKNMFLTTVALIILSNTLSALFLKEFRPLNFIFYAWKEIYVMLMFQQLWSIIHSTISLQRAKYLYGILFAFGGLGSVCGSYIPSFQAVHWGSENLLFSTLPLYLILAFFFLKLLKYSPSVIKMEKEEPLGSLRKGVSLIISSRHLTFILLIVILMQLTSAIVYYQFNLSLEGAILEKDLRTEYAGKMLGLTNFLTIGLQLFGSFLLAHFLGLRKSHILIPAMLGLNALFFFFNPTFLAASFSFLVIKTFDFSVFGILKEMLYIPLKKEEKFQAKAWIDVFAYRSAKALAALLILVFQWVNLAPPVLSATLILLFTLWVGVVVYLFDRRDPVVLESA